MPRPDSTEHAPYYATYVALTPEDDILPVLERQPSEVASLAATVAPDREGFRYEAGKWSIRELLGHVCDTERVFGFRAFCFSRGEEAPLPGFDEKVYTPAGRYDERPLAEIVAEFAAVRAANLAVLRRLDAAAWIRRGTASGNPVTVRALAYMMAGHARHHLGVLRDRYAVGS